MIELSEAIGKDLSKQIEEFFKQPSEDTLETAINSETKRESLRDRQAEIGYGFMPDDCLCPYCGYDFVDDPRSWDEAITGCRNSSCARSYCE